MQKLGLRPEKKAKDQQRMFKLSKMITKDPRIKSSEAKLIHRLLKGRVTNPDIIKDPSKPAFIVRTK